jgi:isoleucyl-tRNA synthetase
MVTSAVAELDRYILGKTAELIRNIDSAMADLDLAAACNAALPFIDALNNWYIRRSRERFWKSVQDADKKAAYDTLYTVLVTATRALAPFLPFLTETIHRALVDGESVHLQNWPDADVLAADATLVERMDLARQAVSAALSIRTTKNLRTRLPLRRLTIAHSNNAILAPLKDVIADEVNVKEVTFEVDPSAYGGTEAAVDSRKVGRRLGKAMKDVLAATKSGAWNEVGGGAIEAAGEVLQAGEYELRFKPREGLDAVPFSGSAGVVVLDTEIDADLESEGTARDFIRLVQVARKEAGFDVSDRIHMTVKADEETWAALETHKHLIKRETLSLSMVQGESSRADATSEAKLNDNTITLGLERA